MSESLPETDISIRRVAKVQRQVLFAWVAAFLICAAIAVLAGLPMWMDYQDHPGRLIQRETVQWAGLDLLVILVVVLSTRLHTRQLLRLALQSAVIERQNSSLRQTGEQLRQEIHEREQAESQRDSFFLLSADLLAILDTEGRFVRLNPAFAAALGDEEARLRGVDLCSFIHGAEADDLRRVLETLDEGGSARTLEARCQTKVWGWCWFLWTFVARQGHIFAVAHDFSSHRAAADTLREAKESAEKASNIKTQFLANMSHELRTPLNAVIGFSETLEMGLHGTLNDKQREYVRDIRSAGQHLLGIVADLLDMSVIDSGAQVLSESEINPRDIIEAAVSLVKKRAAEAGIVLDTILPETLPKLRADAGKLRQIMVNLAGNAIKYTPKCGKVVVRAGLEGDGFAFAVTDTGIGISKADIETALSPFGRLRSAYSGADGGVGLGLPLARRLAELHGGSLTIRSEPGKGTTVTLLLPPERVIRKKTEGNA